MGLSPQRREAGRRAEGGGGGGGRSTRCRCAIVLLRWQAGSGEGAAGKKGARGSGVGGGGYRRPRCGVGERGRWGARGERTQRHRRRPAGSRRTAVRRRRRSGCVRLEVGSGRGARPSVCPSVQAASSHHSTAGVRPGSLREADALPRWDSLPLPPTFSPLLFFFILFFFLCLFFIVVVIYFFLSRLGHSRPRSEGVFF